MANLKKKSIVKKKYFDTEFKHVKCVMNLLPLKNSTIPFKVYNCNSCEGKPSNICELCFEFCHKFHNENMMNVTETLTYMNMTKCSCAMAKHGMNLIEPSKSLSSGSLDYYESESGKKKHREKEEKSICNMHEVLKFTSMKYFYRKRMKKEGDKPIFICIYCISVCKNKSISYDLEDEYEAVPVELMAMANEIPICGCVKNVNHYPFYENIQCLENLLNSDSFDQFLIRLQIPSIILKTPSLFEKYLLPIKLFHNVISDKIQKNEHISLLLEPLTKTYLRSLYLLKTFNKCFYADYFYIKNIEVQKMYNFDYLCILFNSEVVKNDKLVKVKIYCLQFFRKYYIEPLLKFKSLKEFGNFENTSPLHRIIFRKNIDVFFSETNLNKFLFFGLLKKISNQILDYDEKIEMKEYHNLIKEFLRFILILVRYHYDDKDFHYFINLSSLIKAIMNVIYSKINFKSSLHKIFEEIVYNFIFTFNDKAVKNKLFESDNKRFTYFFENGELSTNCIITLFGFNIDASENNNYLRNGEIYDLLINRYDSYSETIKSLLETSSNFFLTNEIKSMVNLKDSDIVNEAVKVFDEINYKNLKKQLDDLNCHKTKFYEGKFAAKQFINLVSISLKELNENLFLIFQVDKSKKFKNFKKQIYILKMGLFDLLLNMWRVIENNHNLFKDEQSYTSIFNDIIACLSQVFVNPKITFLIPILFTNCTIYTFFNEQCKNKKITYFYYQCLKICKKQNNKMNFTFLIEFLIDAYNLKTINLFENLEEVYNLLRIFKKCLEMANDKSLDKTNNLMSYIIKRVISSQQFKNLMREVFPINPLEKHKDNRDNKDANSINDDIYEDSQISLEIKRSFIKEIFYNINHFSNFAFNSITDYIDRAELERIIYSYDDIDTKTRVALTRTLYLFYLESPFYINKNIRGTIDSMCVSVGNNLIADIVIEEEYEVEDLKFEINQNNDEEKDKTDTVEQNFIDLKNLFKIEEDHDYRQEDDESDEFKRDFRFANSNFKYFGLVPLIFNLQKFRTILIKSGFTSSSGSDLNSKKNNECILKYFNRMIFKPTISALFKLIYFSKSFKFKVMYFIFKIIYLFLTCYNYLLHLCLNNLQCVKCSNNITIKSLKKYFVNLEDYNITDIKLHLENIKVEVELTISDFNTLTDLKCNYLMKAFEQVLNKWKPFDIIKNDSSNIDDKYKIKVAKKKLIQESESKNLYCKIYKIYTEYIDRKNNFNSNVLLNLFNSNEARLKEIKNTIALDLISRIEEPDAEHLSNVNESSYVFLESTIRLFKVDPELFQKILVSSSLNSKNKIQFIIKQMFFLFQYVFINFTRLCRRKLLSYNYFVLSLEFLLLLCDNNRIFQTFLIHYIINEEESEQPIYLCEFLIKVSQIIQVYLGHFIIKKEFLKFFMKSTVFYFDKLLTKLHDFYIKLIQGTFHINFEKIYDNSIDYFHLVNKLCFALEHNTEYLFFLSNSIRYLNSLIEDRNNTQKGKIAEMINYRTLFELCMYSFFKLLSGEDVNYKIQQGDSKKLLRLFLHNKEFHYNPFFILSSQIFMLLKHLAKNNVFCKDDVSNIFDDLKEISRKDFKHIEINRKSFDVNIRKSEMFKFFNKVIREVEINFKEDCRKPSRAEFKLYKSFFTSENIIPVYSKIERLMNLGDSSEIIKSKNFLVNVRFLIHPSSLYIREKDIKLFTKKAYKEDSYKMKLNYFLTFFEEEMSTTIMTRENILTQQSETVNVLYNLDYNFLTKVSIGISFVVNFLMIISLYYSSTSSTENNHSEIVSKYSFFIFFISLANIIYLIFLISLFCSFEVYKLSNFIYKEKIEIWTKVKDFLKILLIDEISPLVWSLFFGILGIIKQEWNFLFSLQLFAIFAVYPTMKIVIMSIFLRYKQFMAAAFLIIIFSLFFSSITFFYFRDDFFNEDLNENSCDSLAQCFLSIFNFGIRSQSIGLSMKSINSPLYWLEFAIDWLFYVILILILVNVINGIIVDTFQELREENVRIEHLKNDLCFICSIKRSKFDVRGKDFDIHRREEHNISNYFYYITKIKLSDRFELNSFDYHVLSCINQRKIDFFPVKQTASLIKDEYN